MRAGIAVQNNSVSCDSNRNWLKFVLFKEKIIMLKVSLRIDRISSILWSWKNMRCSIVGELLFCENIFDHKGIYLVIIEVWLKVWSMGGYLLNHSIERFNRLALIVGLLDDKDSHKIYISSETDSIDK